MDNKSNQTYDVFISYRRDGGSEMARLVHNDLTDRGYRVFLDVEDLRSGKFNEKLYEVIDAAKDFILILSPGALDHCVNEDDWVRKEITRALQSDKNIIPVLLKNFKWPSPMPEGLEEVENYNGVVHHPKYFDASIDDLVSKLRSSPQDDSVSKLRSSPMASAKSLSLFKIICAIFVVILAAVLLLAAALARVPVKTLADTFHKWGLHGREAASLVKWRDEPDGRYSKLKGELFAAVENAAKMEEAFSDIDKADPVRKCLGEASIPPWQNDLKGILEAKLGSDYAPEDGFGQVKLENEEKLYARLVFCQAKFPGSEKVQPDQVLKRYFLPYLKEAVKEFGDDHYFESVRKHLRQFAHTRDLRRDGTREVLKPVLRQLLHEIKTKSTALDIDPGSGRPRKDSAEIRQYHEYFRDLRNLTEEFGGADSELMKLLDDYDKFTRNRDQELRPFVEASAKKAEESDGLDLDDWNYCADPWLERFRSEIPQVSYVLWRYGHDPEDPKERRIVKYDGKYLDSIEKQHRDIRARYYAGRIHEQRRDGQAPSFYWRFVESYQKYPGNKKSRSMRKKYIFSLHRTVSLNAEYPSRQWEALILLDQEKQLTPDEMLLMARACSGREGEQARMLQLYKNLPETVMLSREDHFAFLSHSKDKASKLKWFEKLARLVVKDDPLSDLSRFYDVGLGLKDKKADRIMFPVLETALGKGNPQAVRPFIETAIRLGEEDRDLAGDEIIRILSRDARAADVCYEQMQLVGKKWKIRLIVSDEQKAIFRLWVKVVPMEEAQLSRLCRVWNNDFDPKDGRLSRIWNNDFDPKDGRLLLEKLETGVRKKFEKSYLDYIRLAVQLNADPPDDVVKILLESSFLEKNPAEAVKWYRKAAERGCAWAQVRLGRCYEFGEGVEKDPTEAAKWYRKAAGKGDEPAKKALERLNK